MDVFLLSNFLLQAQRNFVVSESYRLRCLVRVATFAVPRWNFGFMFFFPMFS